MPSAVSLSSAFAQDSEGDEKEKKIPKPEDVKLKTEDGVRLICTYYGSVLGKDAVPVVMLPSWKRKRGDFNALALELQKAGYAVLTVDLRGHGESTETESGAKLSADRLPPAQFKSMVAFDMETILGFLWKKNNENELNLNKLVLLGGEMGASVALNYAMIDWSKPDYGPLQMGHFIKGLILLSPEWSFKGLDLRALPTHVAVREKLAVMLLVGGETSKAVTEANRVYDLFKRYHEEPPEGADKLAKKTLFYGKLKTSLQGSRMLEAQNLNVDKSILTFLKLRMVDSEAAKETTWKELKRPHE